MTTEHVEAELNQALEAARSLKEKNDAERRRLLDEQAKAAEKLLIDVEAGAALVRAAQQQHEDEAGTRQHRLAQANRIAGVPPVQPAPAAPPVQPGNTQVLPPVAPVPPMAPAPAPQPPQAQVGLAFFRNRSPLWWAWVAGIALLGLIVGLIVARLTAGPMWSNVHSLGWRTFFEVLWYLALSAAGFLTGGWLGSVFASGQQPRQH